MEQTPLPPLLPTAEGGPAERDDTWSARVWALRHQQNADQLRDQGFAQGRRVILQRAEEIPRGRSPLLFAEASLPSAAPPNKATSEATQATQQLLETLIGQVGQIVEVIQLDGVAHALKVRFASDVEVEVWADCVQTQPATPPLGQTTVRP